MAHQLTHDGKGWVVDEKSSAALIVVERVVSGTFLAQKERLLYPDPSGGSAALEQMVTYQVRNGRIHRLWIYPWVSDKRSPEIQNPTYPAGNGPKVYFDTWHGNVSTPEGAFSSFGDLLRRDGYQVRPWEGEFSAAALRDVDVLIISNAMPHEEGDPMSSVRHDTMNVGASFPPAFTVQEEAAVSDWVAAGGALLLIADHDPYPSTAKSLAARFGAEFHNGRVFDSEKKGGGGDLFSRVDGTLRPHAITDGSETGHVVNSVKTYLGQAFPVTPDIDPLLVLRESMVLKGATDNGKPDEIEVAGWLQAGVREFGQGRVALFGEAWMFRELNDPRTQNPRFILNLMSWLSASSPDESPSRSQ